MNKEQDIILKLKRKAIDPSFSWFIEDKTDWKAAVGFSLKQGVVGITFDPYQQMSESIDSKYAPDGLVVMAGFSYTNILGKKYVCHKVSSR